MPSISLARRRLVRATAAALALPTFGAFAQAPQRTLRIGHQKGALNVLKGRGTLDKRLAPLGVTIRWTEFTAGPVQLEALNVGSIDFGDVGEAPPIFAQAAGAPLAYVAATVPRPARAIVKGLDRSGEPPAQETKFVLETNEETANISDLTALIDAVYASADEDFVAASEARLDLDETLLLGAAQAIIADWDGYFGARNNYKAYHELERDRFVILPWGIDQTFWPEYIDYAIDHSESLRPRSK